MSEARKWLPERFGKYTVLGHLAMGGMAEVYLARASGIEGFEKLVVIKRIRPELAGNSQITEMFLHEARLAATLEHPNIANTYDVGIVEDSYFFAMEYVHGVDLREVLRTSLLSQKPIAFGEAAYVVAGVCAALHYAHEKRGFDGQPLGIIHRDVSPSNVLLSYDGAVKVCDFGIAKAASRTTETAHGVLKGKISYMSPEQCRGEPLDRRSDVFSIAILLYEMSTLTKLFRGKSDFEIMKRIVERPVVPPSRVRSDYPPELERIVMKGLASNPADRYATAQELQIELEAFAREHKMTLSSVGLATHMRRLFQERIDAWQAARAGGQDLARHLTAARSAEPQTGSVQTTDFDGEIAARGELLRQRRPRAGVRLVLAIAALVAGAALFAYGRIGQGASVAALSSEADRLANVVDGEIRALRVRAEAIASTPMVRAAIATDAKTLNDMAASGSILKPAEREALELFQSRDGRVASLLRLPAGAPALEPVRGRDVRIDVAGRELRIATGAAITPLYQARGVDGAVVLAVRVDLEPLRTRLGAQVKRASLRVGNRDVVLVADGASAGDATFTLPLAEAGAPALTLAVARESVAWPVPASAGCGGLAVLLFLLYAVKRFRTQQP